MWRELQPGDPRLIGPYRLRGLLGTGGMGRVFLGVSPGGRPVAVKVIRADLAADAEFRTRFRREVAVARKVSGQFTAPVIDADLDGPVPWLATAYVAGPSLADAVATSGPLPAGSVLELAAGLAEGLSAIHAVGVVHRDLKPANVLLAQDGPRMIDFGISLGAEASALTRTGLVVGSPGFMSPEQAEGREVGPPSDIFSLGAVLAFAATGRGPFGGGSTPALVYRVVHRPATLDDVPAEVRPLIDRCLAKDPGRRPTARDLLAQTGAVHPADGWLPEPVTRTFVQLPTQAGSPKTVTSLDPSPSPSPSSTPSPVPSPSPSPSPVPLLPPDQSRPQAGARRPRRRLGRPLAIASMVTGLLAASAVGGLALTASAHPSSAAHAGQTARAQMTLPVTSAPPQPADPGASLPATPTATATTPPAGTATPPATTTPPATATPATAPATTAPAQTTTPAATATPAASTTAAGSAPSATAAPQANPAPAATGSPAPAAASWGL